MCHVCRTDSQTAKRLSAERWTLLPLNDHHFSYVGEESEANHMAAESSRVRGQQVSVFYKFHTVVHH